MGKAIKLKEDQIFNAWKVIEPNIINPNTNGINKNKPIYSKCICTKCNKTIRYILNSELNSLRVSKQCNSCNLIERNTKNRSVQIGQQYGFLKVIGDAGYKIQKNNKKRHYSLCECQNCGKIVEVMDNQMQSGNKISCGCISSKGESIIEKILLENKIIYNRDCIFPQLLEETKRRLRFDFIIYNEDGSINRFIEFDGHQHKKGWIGGNWSHEEDPSLIQERDTIKNNFCLKHNYILVRIPYDDINKLSLETIMGEKYILCNRKE